ATPAATTASTSNARVEMAFTLTGTDRRAVEEGAPRARRTAARRIGVRDGGSVTAAPEGAGLHLRRPAFQGRHARQDQRSGGVEQAGSIVASSLSEPGALVRYLPDDSTI